MIRAVLDTNVFVSAFLLPGRLNRLAGVLLKRAFLWLVSDEILEEYVVVATWPLLRLSSDEMEALFYQVKERTEWISVRSQINVTSADPSDNKFLACAVDGNADWIVTGDHHLLALKKFRNVRIGTPSEFLITLRS